MSSGSNPESRADPAPLEIALALIFRDGRVLITRRPMGVHLAGLWEFPGGKCRAGEPPADCAEREAREEVGVACRAEEVLSPLLHTYPERTVRLHPVICRHETGEPRALAVAEWAWVRPGELSAYEFPPANASLVRRLVDPDASR